MADPPAPGSAERSAASTGDDVNLAPAPRRETLTSLELRILVSELQILVGGHLDKAYQPSRGEVLLRFRARELGRRDLFIRRGGFLCLTERPPENPVHPPGFAMALRKHVCGGRVAAIRQHGFDRVVIIEVQKHDGLWQIVVEAFGDGNCIVVRPDGRIFVPLTHERWAHRTIRPGAPYETPPPRTDPMAFDAAAFVQAAGEGKRDIVRALTMECNLGGPTSEEVLLRAGIQKDTLVADVDDDGFAAIFAAWSRLRSEIVEVPARASLILEGGRAVDVVGFDSRRAAMEVASSGGGLTIRSMASFSAALDELFLAGRHTASRVDVVEEVDERKTKLSRQSAAQEEAVERFTAEAARRTLEGETIFAHYATVERILATISAARREHDWGVIDARLAEGRDAGNEDAGLVVRLEPRTGTVVLRLDTVSGDSIEVPVDVRRSVGENAEAAYDAAKKARERLAGAETALASTRERMAGAERDLGAAREAVDEAMRRSEIRVPATRHFWFEGFRWFYSSTGHLVVAGRDATTNDRLVKKHLEDGDRYVHADIHGAPSTVVKQGRFEHAPAADDGAPSDPEDGPGTGRRSARSAVVGKEPPDDASLREAAQAAVSWSRAFGRFGGADAYWVTPPQVSKTPQAGEFLAKGAFIVRGERQWFRKLPLRLSLGLVWLDASGRPWSSSSPHGPPADLRLKIMGGMPDAVHRWAETWVDVEAGPLGRKEAVKRLASALSAHPDTIDRVLPPADIAIVGSKGIPEDALADPVRGARKGDSS